MMLVQEWEFVSGPEDALVEMALRMAEGMVGIFRGDCTMQGTREVGFGVHRLCWFAAMDEPATMDDLAGVGIEGRMPVVFKGKGVGVM